MKNIFKFLVSICFLTLKVSGSPTTRPLPKRILDGNSTFTILRDHLESDTFYLLPKNVEVTHNDLAVFGSVEANCKVVEKYDTGLENLADLSIQSALSVKNRFEVLNSLLENQRNVLQRYNSVEAERNKVSLSILSGAVTDPAQLKEAQARLAILQQDLQVFSEKRASIAAEVKACQELATAEQANIKIQTDAIRLELKELEKILVKPGAEIKIVLKVPGGDLDDEGFRKSLGFTSSDKVLFPPLVGVELYPQDEEEELSYWEERAVVTSVGIYKASWNLKSLKVQETALRGKTLPEGIETRSLPKEILFGQRLSRRSYCAVKGFLKDKSTRLLTPLKISLAVPIFKDDTSITTGQELFSYRTQLETSIWDKVKTYQALIVAPQEEVKSDPGNPGLFSGAGTFDVLYQSIGFKFPESTQVK